MIILLASLLYAMFAAPVEDANLWNGTDPENDPNQPDSVDNFSVIEPDGGRPPILNPAALSSRGKVTNDAVLPRRKTVTSKPNV